VQQVLVETFDDDLRRMTPERFAREILGQRLEARFVALGPSHTFGAGRAAGPDRMAELGREFGFEVEIVPVVSLEGTVVSSTSVRAALAAGDAALACRLLGRPYSIIGCVVPGLGLGRALGSPTANLQVDPDKLLPAEGVYAAAAVFTDSDAAPLPAAVVIGPAPTLNVHEPRVEAHLLDFDSDLYGRELALGLMERLRPIEAFPDTQALSRQIRRDCEQTRRLFAQATAAGGPQ
jgi:riboflavin kinase/FMN adenylyltransferase